METILTLQILLSVIFTIFTLVNFLFYLIEGKVITNKKLWTFIQIWTIAVAPILFLSSMDLFKKNNCCTSSAIFSPEHRLSIYVLIFLSAIALTISVLRKDIFPPIAEMVLNSLLCLGFILNVLFCIHFTTIEDSFFWWLFGNVPIILILIITLIENQKKIKCHILENKLSINNRLGKFSLLVLQLDPIFKYPFLTFLLIPIIMVFSILLMLFGQKPDSLIRAFTETYKHGFSQLDHLCDNVECGGHFLCSVGANGHKGVVKPIRYGMRQGNKIICNRQLLISNAFEELIQEKLPYVHHVIRRNYNKVGDVVHRYYGIFNNKYVSDFVYIVMKPFEWLFLLTLYTFDRKPENRIAKQYLNSIDSMLLLGVPEFHKHQYSSAHRLP